MGKSRYINERDRTLYGVNFDLLDGLELTEKGFPKMQPLRELPKVDEWIEFNRLLTYKGRPGNCAVHFWIDDYQFDRVWNRPWEWAKRLADWRLVGMSQFSNYADFPIPLQYWQQYRNQLLGAFWQKQGITVLPTPGWGGEETFSWTFEGVPEGGWHGVGTVGVTRYADAKVRFIRGLRELIDQKHPDGIVLYGVVIPETKAMLEREGIPYKLVRQGQRIRHDAYMAKMATRSSR